MDREEALKAATEPGPMDRESALDAAAVPKGQLVTNDGRYRVIDGDTIEDTDSKKVYRLRGINTTELGNVFSDSGKGKLKSLLDNAGDRLQIKEGEQDVYGRTIAELSADDLDINREMVSSGAAFTQRYRGEEDPQLAKEESQASLRYLGVMDPTEEDLARREEVDAMPAAPRTYRERPKPHTLPQEFGEGVRRGTDSLQGAGYGAVSLVGSALNLDSVRDLGMENYLRNQEEGARHAPSVTFKEMEVGDNFFQWAAGALGEAVPSMATMIGGGGGAAMLGRGFVKRQVERHTVNKAAEAMTKYGVGEKAALKWVQQSLENPAVHKQMYDAAMKASLGTVAATSGVPQAGSIFAEIYQEAGVEAPGTATLAGGLAGALDTVPFGVLTKALFPGMEQKVVKNLLLETAKVSGQQTLIEGSTEAAQEFIANVSRAVHDDDYDALGEEAMDRVYAAAATGALVGAVTGGVAGPFTAKKEQEDAPDERGGEEDAGADVEGAGSDAADAPADGGDSGGAPETAPAAEPVPEPAAKAAPDAEAKQVVSVEEEQIIKGLGAILPDERANDLYKEIAKNAVSQPDKDPLTPKIKERLIRAQKAQPLSVEEIPEHLTVRVTTMQDGKAIEAEVPARQAVESIDRELGMYERLAKCLAS